jgi:hypothetical protein
MKKLMLLVLSTALVLSAAFVPVDRAKTVAENQYKQYCADASTKSANIVRVVENRYEGEITWYAFEFDKGFVIVSADDSVRPILGYSDHGNIPSDQKWQFGGQNFKEWFGKYDREISYMRKNNVVDKAGAQSWKDIEANVFQSTKAGIIVDRLITSEWDQVWPWNDLCPEKSDGTWTYVGCVATSMAQITRYHRWPDIGVGSDSYSWNNGSTNITLSANFASQGFNYNLMPAVVDIEYGLYPTYWESGITQAEVDELARHSYWMGISVRMQYGNTADGGSGAYSADVDNAFLDHWKASSSAQTSFATPAAGAADASYSTITAQLSAKRPWYWSGGVHAFNLDGYRDDSWYHFNWGWGGSYDGWFHRSSLVPGGIGSGGGDGDFTSGQSGITYVPSTNPFTAWPATTVSGSLSGDDITVSWTAQTGATGYKIYRTVGKQDNGPEYVETVTGTSKAYNDMPAGEYAYSVIVTYSTGESHISNAYSATVVANSSYPVARGVTAAVVGRTNIDVSWTAPYVGVLNAYVDFETGALPTDWLDKTSYSPNTGSCWTTDPNDWVFVGHKDSFAHWFYQSRIDGYFVLMSAAATETLWLFSPSYTFNANHSVKWWMRFRYTDDTGAPVTQRPIFQWTAYAGTFTETKRETNIAYTTLGTYDGASYPENIWASEESLSLASLNGLTRRLAIRVAVNSNDMYTMGFDKITIGSTSGGGDQPNGYQVYRNGTLATTVGSGTTYAWSDTAFADGDNTYYVKATYPTGTSIASNYKTVWIDANPKPSDLIGNVSPATSANLSWYIPYHNRPKWYMHMDPTTGFSTTTLDDATVVLQKKRVIFKAEDLGYYYPITLDSVAAVFYDWNEGNWGGVNKFNFRILTGGSGAFDNVVYTSPELTAVHNTMIKHKLSTPMVLSEPFNVEVYNTTASDFPTNLSGFGPDPVNTHSYFEYDPGTGVSYYYGITGGDNWYEWAFQAYITSSTPSKSNAWVSSVAEPKVGIEKTRTGVIPTPYKGKALDYYKVYRNGSYLGQTINLNYTDSAVPANGNYTYTVTAAYTSPAGESAPSNEVVLYVEGGGAATPDVPANVVTSVVSGNIFVNWDDSANATNYDVYASANPYGTFSFLANVTVSEYTYTPGTNTKMFFYIVAKN